MAHSAYVRVDPAGTQVFETWDSHGWLLVDVAPGSTASNVRDALPHRLLRSCRKGVVVRVDDGIRERVCEAVNEALMLEGRPQDVMTIEHPFGSPASILTATRTPATDAPTHASLRDLEIRALIDLGGALLRPRLYHYVLPNGDHSGCFLRTRRMLRSERDAHVLAQWLREYVAAPEHTLVVVDTPDILSVPLAFRGGDGASVSTLALGQYPRSAIDVEQRIRGAMNARSTSHVVAVISVNWSGSTREKLMTALRELRDESQKSCSFNVVEFVDLSTSSGETAPEIHPWVRGGFAKFSSGSEKTEHADDRPTSPTACELCHDSKRAPAVRIDHATYEPSFDGNTRLHTLDVRVSPFNRDLWTFLSEQRDGLHLSAPSLASQRQNKKMSVRVDFAPVAPAFASKVVERIDQRALMKDDAVPTRIAKPRFSIDGLRGADLVVVLEDDWKTEYDVALLPALRLKLLWGERCVRVPSNGQLSLDERQLVLDAHKIVVLLAGIVGGSSVQRALSAIQSIRRSRDGAETISALVLHARPSNDRVMQTLVNSFAERLYVLWYTPLPEVCPFEREQRLLANAGSSYDASRFASDRRVRLHRGALGPNDLVFWGQRVGDRLSPASLFGDSLNAGATFAAVGASIESVRHRRMEPPERLRFELQAIFRSYYDPFIIASVLRWLRPEEQHWGSENDLEVLLSEMRRRSEPDERAMRILPLELALALHEGKMPNTESARTLLQDWIQANSDATIAGERLMALELLERAAPKPQSS